VKATSNQVTILIADDDPNDRMLMKKALDQNKTRHLIHFVENGADLTDYLPRRGRYLARNVDKPTLNFIGFEYA
jgi:CheY-like chemotaxis protein